MNSPTKGLRLTVPTQLLNPKTPKAKALSTLTSVTISYIENASAHTHCELKNKYWAGCADICKWFLVYCNPLFRREKKKGKTRMTNVCLPGRRCASRKQSLPLPVKTRIKALAARGACLAHSQWTVGKDSMAYFFRKPAAKSKRGREKWWEKKELWFWKLWLADIPLLSPIICLTVDTTLITDGQVGPGQEQGFGWNWPQWNCWAQSNELPLVFQLLS